MAVAGTAFREALKTGRWAEVYVPERMKSAFWFLSHRRLLHSELDIYIALLGEIGVHTNSLAHYFQARTTLTMVFSVVLTTAIWKHHTISVTMLWWHASNCCGPPNFLLYIGAPS